MGVAPGSPGGVEIADVLGLAVGPAHLLRLEELAQQLPHADRQQALEEGAVLARQPGADGVEGRRLPEVVRVDDRCGPAPEGEPLREALGVAPGNPGDLLPGALEVLPDQHAAAVGKGGEAGRVRRVHVEAVGAELEVVDYPVLQQVADVGAGGEPVSREKLLGDAGPAEQVAPFEKQDVEAGAGEVAGGDQAVVPAPEDYGVAVVDVGLLVDLCLSIRAPRGCRLHARITPDVRPGLAVRGEV